MRTGKEALPENYSHATTQQAANQVTKPADYCAHYQPQHSTEVTSLTLFHFKQLHTGLGNKSLGKPGKGEQS